MTRFCTASPIQQSLLMTALLLVLLVSLFSMRTAFDKEKRKLYGWIDTGLFLLLFTMLVMLANRFSQVQEEVPSGNFGSIPMWLLWCVTGASFVYLLLEAIMRYRRRDRTLDRNCVKQAMDRIPCAVCYFTQSGKIKLCNLQMYRLFQFLSQKELQSLDDLTLALDECSAESGILRLSDARKTYLFPDGKVWRYSQSTIAAKGIPYIEVLFTDVTALYEKNWVLQQQTVQLQKISRDIKQLSENVQTLAAEREILAAKSKLHDQMGAGLLAIRHLLRQKTSSVADTTAVEQFRRAVRILREENVRPQYDVATLIQDAAVSGVRVEISGVLPKEKATLRLLLPMLREACVNAARHADATALYVAVENRENTVTLRITNDGKQPVREIVPCGGLANHRKRIVEAGGSMEVQSQPVFMLTVTLPAEEKAGDSEGRNDECTDCG